MTGLTLILRFVVIGLIYIILLRLIRIMIIDLRATGKEVNTDFAIEALKVSKGVSFNEGTIFPVNKELTIGRKKNNMLIVQDPYVSSRHARLFEEKGKLFVEDLGSTNGTIYNGKLIKEKTLLNVGDKIKIGDLIFKVI